MVNKIYFDGGSALNIICVYDETRKTYHTEKMKTISTNNALEYAALLKAVHYAKINYLVLDDCLFCGDSELIILQMRGKYKVRKPHLKQFYDTIIDEIKPGRYVKKELDELFMWVPREQNLAGIILDGMLFEHKAAKKFGKLR